MSPQLQKWASTGERAARAFVGTFVATLVASGVFDVKGITDVSLWEKAALAGLASLASLILSLVGSSVGNTSTPSLLPASLDPATGVHTITQVPPAPGDAMFAGLPAVPASVVDPSQPQVMNKPSGLHPMAAMPELPPYLPKGSSHPGKKLGKRSPSNKPALHFADHVATVPTHPIADLAPKLSWPMDHNDTVGDCVVACADHTLQAIYTQLTGSYVNASDALMLTWYQTQNPSFKSWSQGGTSVDQGMDIQTFLEYLVKQDRILGFAKVDHTNLDEMRAATYLGLGVVTGEVLTSKNMSEKVWDYHPGDSQEGGHCTVNVGYNPTEDQVSWGALYSMTDAFVTHNLDEAWFVITQAHVDNAAFRAGFDLTSFAAAYKEITGKAFPVAVPTPPNPPTPTPPAPPAPAPSADPFLAEVAVYPALLAELERLSKAKGETVEQYAAWRLASATHTLS